MKNTRWFHPPYLSSLVGTEWSQLAASCFPDGRSPQLHAPKGGNLAGLLQGSRHRTRHVNASQWFWCVVGVENYGLQAPGCSQWFHCFQTWAVSTFNQVPCQFLSGGQPVFWETVTFMGPAGLVPPLSPGVWYLPWSRAFASPQLCKSGALTNMTSAGECLLSKLNCK